MKSTKGLLCKIVRNPKHAGGGRSFLFLSDSKYQMPNSRVSCLSSFDFGLRYGVSVFETSEGVEGAILTTEFQEDWFYRV